MRPLPAGLLVVLLACGSCGSQHSSDDATADATTGAESNESGSGGTMNATKDAGPAGGSSGSSAGASGSSAGTSGSSAGTGGSASAPVCDPSCPDGQRCELKQVTCIRAPCPPLPMCVAAAPASCDPAKILCKRVAPECPQGQVPSVSGSCYGPCVPVESCACSKEAECPDHDQYTCHLSAGHCGPYV
jgi:hypothetical protein